MTAPAAHIGIFEWGYKIKTVTLKFLRALLGGEGCYQSGPMSP
jgi:hypothetical protein